MNNADTGDEAWEEAKESDRVKNDINDENNSYQYRVDILWWHIPQLCIPRCSVKRFKYLIKLAELVLAMPHTNAELERLFSIVREKKTLERSFSKLDGSSILAVKTMYPESNCPCLQWKPDDMLLEASKKATTKAINRNTT